jgi:hypothetical protein
MSKKKATKTKRPAAAGAKTKTAPAEKWTAYFHADQSEMQQRESGTKCFDGSELDCILLLRGEPSREREDRMENLCLANIYGTRPEWTAEQGIISAETFAVLAMDGQVRILTSAPAPAKVEAA